MGITWKYGHRNIIIRVFCFILSVISILLTDKLITDKKEIFLLNIPFKFFKDKIYFLPNTIDTKVFNPHNNEDITINRIQDLNKNNKILLYVGRLADETSKNPDLLFKSFEIASQDINNIKLLIIGINDNDFDCLIKKHNVKNKNNIINIGILANCSLPTYYRFADLTLLTSNFEGTPFVILESLACGTPCISTDVLDKGIIEDGINGFICKSRRPANFARLIENGIEILSKAKKEKRSMLSSIYDSRNREENLTKIFNR